MSDESFKVGDVVEILHGSAADEVRHCIGMEGSIEELNIDRMWNGVPCHGVVTKSGERLNVSASLLRKKRPPPVRERTSTWDDVLVWRPKELTHV